MACECAQNWRIELVFWGTGETLSVIVPEKFSFESVYQEHGRGSVTFKMQGNRVPMTEGAGGRVYEGFINTVPLYDMWPGDVGIIIARVAGPGASWENMDGMFAGTIETVEVDARGLATLGFVGVTEYLERRLIRETYSVTGEAQTDIARALVNYAYEGTFTPGGVATDDQWVADTNVRLIPTVTTAGSITRTRTYEASKRYQIWKLLQQLMQISNGPEYRLNILRLPSDARWAVEMDFLDPADYASAIGGARNIDLLDLVDTGIRLDRKERANLTEVFGRDNQIVTRNLTDADSVLAGVFRARYVRHDETSTYDVSSTSDLEAYGDGRILDRWDPACSVSLTFSGLEYSPELSLGDLVPGAYVNLRIGSRSRVPWRFVGGPDIEVDAGTYMDDLRLGKVSVSVAEEGPEVVQTTAITSKPTLARLT